MATKAELAALAEVQAEEKNRPNSGTFGLQKTSSVALSGKQIQLPSGESVPIEFYDWVKDQQQVFLEVKAAVQKEAANESLSLQYSKSLGDQVAALAKRQMALERDSVEKDAVIVGLVRLVEQQSTVIEIAKSDSLVEAESQAAQTVVNMAATTSDGNALIQRIDAAKEAFNREADARIAEVEQQVSTLVGTVKSSTTLIQERTNAAVNQIAAVEPKVQGLDVQLIELENRTDAIGNPITRAEVKDMVSSMVTAEVAEVAPVLIDQQVAEDRDLGVINPGGPTMSRDHMVQHKKDSNRRTEQMMGRDFDWKKSSKGRK